MNRQCHRIYIRKRSLLHYAAVCACIGLVLLSAGLVTGNKNVFAEDIHISEPSANKKNAAKKDSRIGGNILADGNYAVDVELTSGGSGKAGVETPTLMVAEEGEYFAQITWSSPNYDYMLVEGDRYENQSRNGGNSSFMIPITAFDEDVTVIADTVAMGTPHEIQYTFHFYSDSIAPESSLPKEGAKRVLMMAAVIIIAGGILNHYTNKRRRKDYCG